MYRKYKVNTRRYFSTQCICGTSKTARYKKSKSRLNSLRLNRETNRPKTQLTTQHKTQSTNGNNLTWSPHILSSRINPNYSSIKIERIRKQMYCSSLRALPLNHKLSLCPNRGGPAITQPPKPSTNSKPSFRIIKLTDHVSKPEWPKISIPPLSTWSKLRHTASTSGKSKLWTIKMQWRLSLPNPQMSIRKNTQWSGLTLIKGKVSISWLQKQCRNLKISSSSRRIMQFPHRKNNRKKAWANSNRSQPTKTPSKLNTT